MTIFPDTNFHRTRSYLSAFIKAACLAVLFCCFFLSNAQFASASTLYMSPVSQSSALGQEFMVKLVLDTGGKSVNAVQFSVNYNPENFALQQIVTTNTIPVTWIESPVDNGGTITGSGIMPGGWSSLLEPHDQKSSAEPMLSFIFTSKTEGQHSLSLSNVQVLLNDGKGTPDSVSLIPSVVNVTPSEGGIQVAFPKSSVGPINLTVQVFESPLVFNGAPSLVFSAQAGSTIVDHYEVVEGPNGSWQEAVSPYQIKNPYSDETIYVKAVDESGNSTVTAVHYAPRENAQPNSLSWVIISVIALAAIFAISLIWKKWKKRPF